MANPLLCHQEGNSSMSWGGFPRSHYQPLILTKPKDHNGVNLSSMEMGNFSAGRHGSTNSFPRENWNVSSSVQHDYSLQKPWFLSADTDTQKEEVPANTQPSKKRLSETKENKHKFSKKEENAAHCYVCNKIVHQHRKFSQHLFFGSAQCIKCGMKCEDCLTFKLLNSCVNAECDHSLAFTQNTYSSLVSKFLGHDSENSVVLDFIKNCRKLYSLAGAQPWSPIIDMCGKYARVMPVDHVKLLSVSSKKRKASSNHKGTRKTMGIVNNSGNFGHNANETMAPIYRDTKSNGMNMSEPRLSETYDVDNEVVSEHMLSQTYDLDLLDQAVEYVEVQNENAPSTPYPNTVSPTTEASQPSKKQKMKSNSASLIKMPEDGNYLVLRQHIEECPMCYTELCPSKFLVNVVSFLITTVCTGCDLIIYFVVSPSVSVITDVHTNGIKRRGRPRKKKHEVKLTKALAVQTISDSIVDIGN